MTPIRETIASAALDSLPNRTVAYVDLRDLSRVVVSGSVDLLAMADAVLRALDEAGCVVVPREPTFAQTKAMAESEASDHEGTFGPLCDMIGFSGENKTHTVLRAAYRAMISAHTGRDSNGADVSVLPSVVE